MPFPLASLPSTTNSNIQSYWPWNPIQPDALKFISAIADAFADSFSSVLQSTTIVGGTILGGVAPPGGPVVGAVLTLMPGSLVMLPLNFKASFVPPDYSVGSGSQERHGSNTAWHDAFVSTLDTAMNQALAAWTPTWTNPAGSAGGGIAAWVPGTPPLPGPWTNGTIVPFTFLGQGLNPSPSLAALSTQFEQLGRIMSVTVKSDDMRTMETELCVDSSGPMLDAVANGISQTMLNSFSEILVKDQVAAGSAAGIAAPGGVVTGAIATLALDIV